ncbi:PAS domain-containing sensor histidine kinase [Phenylobacterium hankyongense]|nr:ATP-binding protein [Phenylobacterium hankyongense]
MPSAVGAGSRERAGRIGRRARPRSPDAGVTRGEIIQAILALVCGVAIFAVDTFTPLGSAVAVLYGIVVMLASGVSHGWQLVRLAYVCILLTVTSYLLVHGVSYGTAPFLRFIVSLSAIFIATALVLRNQASNEALRAQAALLDLTHDAIFTRSLEDRIAFWNRGAEELYGCPAAEALGASPHQLLHTEDTADVPAISAELLRAGHWEGELTHRRRDGAQVVVASRWAVRYDESGRPVEILESNTDITNRKRADAELRRSEARYRAIFEGARVGIWSADYTGVKARLNELLAAGELAGPCAPEIAAHARTAEGFMPDLLGRITDIEVNDALVRMSGARDRADLIARVDQMLAPEATAPFSGLLQALVGQDVAYEAETPFRTFAGEPLPTWMSVAITRSDGRDRLLITVTDLRPRRHAEEALARAREDLAHANRLATFGEFTATIAHEVNQPLAAISANGAAALRWLDRPEPQLGETRAALERIIRDGRRASEIVAGIRGMLKKSDPQYARLDIPQLIDDVARLVQRELQARGATLKVRTAPDLPAVRGDHVQLQQVLINLLINGAQAMAGTPGPRTLEVNAELADDEHVLVQVRDSGAGISEENMGRLFGAFFTTKPDGMGMGLAICRSTVEAHGGRIWAERPDGPGALIAFSLPTAQAAAA